MSCRLVVSVGPFASCKYDEGFVFDVDAMAFGERLTEIDCDDDACVVWFGPNVERCFSIDDKRAPRSLGAKTRFAEVKWFAEAFAKELAIIAKATGHTPKVEWGVHAAYW